MRYSTDENLRCIDGGIYGVHCGREECMPGHSFGPFMRDHYLIHYIESGKGIFEVNDTVYNIGPGEIFYIVPKVITYYEADKTEPWAYKWVGLRGRHLESIFKMAGLSAKNPVMKVNKEVSESIDILLKISESNNETTLKFSSCAYDFLNALAKNNKNEATHKTNGQIYVDKAVDYIWRYVYRKITVSELADYINVDRSYLSAIFKQYTGLSPQQYILEVKMKTACEYLDSTDYNITQVAQSVGYDDLFVFSHAFKKFIGISPKTYKETPKQN